MSLMALLCLHGTDECPRHAWHGWELSHSYATHKSCIFGQRNNYVYSLINIPSTLPPFFAFNLNLGDYNINEHRTTSYCYPNLNFKLRDVDLTQSNSILSNLLYNLTTQAYYTKVPKYNKIYFGSIGLFKTLNFPSEI